jgi:hypothetical protein
LNLVIIIAIAIAVMKKIKRRRPSHLRFATTDTILEHIIEIGRPIERERRRADNIEVSKSVIISLAMEVFRF